MMARGYLWTRLHEEIAEEFAQPHPLVQMSSDIPLWEIVGWHIEGALGDMSGRRRSLKRRREESSTSAVRETRARRREHGRCIDCEQPRHPRSKNYCARHREADRQRAARKREAKRMVANG